MEGVQAGCLIVTRAPLFWSTILTICARFVLKRALADAAVGRFSGRSINRTSMLRHMNDAIGVRVPVFGRFHYLGKSSVVQIKLVLEMSQAFRVVVLT